MGVSLALITDVLPCEIRIAAWIGLVANNDRYVPPMLVQMLEIRAKSPMDMSGASACRYYQVANLRHRSIYRIAP